MLLCHVPAEVGGREEPLYAYSLQNCWGDVDADGVAPGLKMGQQDEGYGVRRLG